MEFDELSKENSQPETDFQSEVEFPKFTNMPNTLKESNTNLPGTSKNLNEV